VPEKSHFGKQNYPRQTVKTRVKPAAAKELRREINFQERVAGCRR
jgi:hypothetical protein